MIQAHLRRALRAAPAVACLWTALAGVASAADAPPAEDAALRDYLGANGMLHRGLYELAAAEYRKFLDAHGNHAKAPVARYGLAVSLLRMKQYDAASEELDRLAPLPEFEYAAEVLAMRGQCQLAMKRWPEAIEAFRGVLDRHGEHDLADDAAAGLVEALYLEGQHEAAGEQAKAFDTKWAKSPLSARVHFFHALSLLARREYAPAAELFEKVARLEPEGSLGQQAAPLLAQCREHSDFHSARKHFDGGRFDRAQAAFDTVAGSDGELADDAAYWAAKCLLRREKFADAARRLAEAAERYQDSELRPEMIFDCAVACARGGDDAAAIEALNQFGADFADHALAPEALHLSASVEHRNRNYEASAAHCRQFLERFEDHERVATVAFLLAENRYLSANTRKRSRPTRAF